MYCDNCKYLSLTEKEQNIKKKYKKTPLYHTCLLLNETIFHDGQHPYLPKLESCPLQKYKKEKR